jgi:hypothetical protein
LLPFAGCATLAFVVACSPQIETLPAGSGGGGGGVIGDGGAGGGAGGGIVSINLDASVTAGSGGTGTSLGSGNCSKTVGWTCNLPDCADPDVGTTITGKVYDPAGKNPL